MVTSRLTRTLRQASIHLHAKLPQPHLPRRRARDAPLLPRYRRGLHPLVARRPRRPDPTVGRPIHQTRRDGQLPQVPHPQQGDGDRQEHRRPVGGGREEERRRDGARGYRVVDQATGREPDRGAGQQGAHRPGGRGGQVRAERRRGQVPRGTVHAQDDPGLLKVDYRKKHLYFRLNYKTGLPTLAHNENERPPTHTRP